MALAIRQATRADRDELALMLCEVIDYFDAMAGGTWEGKPSREALARCADLSFADPPWCTTLIAEDAGRALGYLAYTFGIHEIHPSLHVAGLYVREDARGKGIGKALMAEAREIARKRGATHLDWLVWRQNQPAQAFYRALGADFHDEDIMMVMPVLLTGAGSTGGRSGRGNLDGM